MRKWQAKYLGYKQRVEESFSRQGFMQYLKAELVEVSEGFCEIHLPYDANLTQQHGFFHAGVISTIADNAAGYAAFSLMGENSSVLSVEFKVNLLSPANGELLIGRSRVLKNGKTLTVCQSEIFVESKGREKLCALAQVTLIELENRKDMPS